MDDSRKTFQGETPETSDCVLCHYCGDILHAPEEDIFWKDTANHTCTRGMAVQIEALTAERDAERARADRAEARERALLNSNQTQRDALVECASLRHRLSEMTRRRDEWRKKAEGFDSVRLALREKVGTPWPPSMSRLLWAGIAADDSEARVAELEGLVERAKLLIDPCYPQKHADWQNDARATLNKKGPTDAE